MLLNALKGGYYENLLTTPQSNNFSQTLPAPVADYANEVFRSRYNLKHGDTFEASNPGDGNPGRKGPKFK